jgi:iron complex outermembrane receptor protein
VKRVHHIHLLGALHRFSPNLKLTAGVKNLFDRDPPFAITYDSNTAPAARGNRASPTPAAARSRSPRK